MPKVKVQKVGTAKDLIKMPKSKKKVALYGLV